MHENGICHNDIKLENIVIQSAAYKDGTITPIAKIIDFGYSEAVSLENPLCCSSYGTQPYMAPEILRSRYGKIINACY